jgi:lipopolysaccharide/colanic/teichoic acid biosynthesis glycosyltransferase
MDQPESGAFVWVLAVTLATHILLFEAMALDCFGGGWNLAAVLSKISTLVVLQLSFVLTWAYLSRIYYSRLVLGSFAILLWLGFIVIRAAAYGFVRHQHRSGHVRRVMLVGSGRIAHELTSKIQRHPELLYEIVGTLSPFGNGDQSISGTEAPAGNSMGSIDVLELLKRQQVDELIVVLEHSPGIEMQNFLVRCSVDGIGVNLLPQPYQLYISRPKLIEIDGVPLVSLEEPASSRFFPVFKRTMDLVFGILLTVPAALIVAAAGLLLYLRQRRFLKREVRCGQYGRTFLMWRIDVPRDLVAARTPYEVFLRRLSISEMPQLWNVLRGEMSLVGPRPEDPERVRHYSEWQRQRLKVKPGITGLAQVNGLGEQHPSEQKARYDLQYLLQWSPMLDLVLLVQTILTLSAHLLEKNRPAIVPVARIPVEKPRPAASEYKVANADRA